jgi:zinc/manganese transport system substrate-binding protein
MRKPLITIALVGVAGALLAACATTAPASGAPATGTITVVAAENFWGSIAGQLGGDHVTVTSVITNPDTDPHAYEPTPADSRIFATARYVIVNGIGYDSWATRLIAANPAAARVVRTVGDLVGVRAGGNPHRWYSPDDVRTVIDTITEDYQRIDPGHAAYFASRKQQFETGALSQYMSLIATIKAKYAGTPIGASESVVTPLADGLGLTMLTPETFLDAISEGSEPSSADLATIDKQIQTKQIRIYIDNSQNSTPDVQAQVALAHAAGIPVTSVTETLTPANATFQDWQVTQLRAIQAALATATGK